MNPPIVVIGGSVAGMASALFLARAGHEVVVLDRDETTARPRLVVWPRADDPAPRRATPQANHSHIFLARLRVLLAERAPDVLDVLLANGVREIALRDGLPPMLSGSTDPCVADPELIALASRRTTLEEAFRAALDAEPGVDVRPGVAVTDIVLADGDPAPALAGVVLDDGTAITTDLVIDASGRRTAVPGWLQQHGVEARLTASECGIAYLSRFYRTRPGLPELPLTRGFTSGSSFDGWSCLVFPGDNGTFSVTFGVLPEDRELRGLTDPDAFDAAVAAIPSLAPWIDDDRAEPISAVATMTGLKNRLRRNTHDGAPVILGVAAVGDAAATTNPAHSRGCTLAMIHAAAVADAIHAHRDAPVALADALDEVVLATMRPWVEDSIEQDAVRLARWRAGAPPAPPRRDDRLTNGELYGAAQSDPESWRAFSRMQNLLAWPDEVLADPAVVSRVRSRSWPSAPAADAPTRSELIELIGRHAGHVRRRGQVRAVAS